MSVKSLFFCFLCAFAIFSKSANAITVGEIVSPAEEFLDCNQLKWYEQVACEKIANEVNKKLEDKNITLSNGSLVYKLNPVTPPRQIPTGHSCSHRAWIRSNYININLSSDAYIDISGDSISKPFLAYIELPISVYTRANFKEKWGYRFLGSCNTSAEDSYYADASLSTVATARIFLSLEPKLNILGNGDFEVIVEPIFDVAMDFDNDLEFDFDFHGRSILGGFMTLLSAFSSVFQIVEGLHLGESVREEVDTLKISLALSFLQTVESTFSLSGDFFDLVGLEGETNIFNRIVDDVAYKEINDILEDEANVISTKLRSEISEALDLDQNGKKTFVVKKEVIMGELSSALVPIYSLVM